ncbi:MAG TPA: superoxide dismutase [Marmoricola sp.]|nr:superoxide dismutase [Marmoricola sp.]
MGYPGTLVRTALRVVLAVLVLALLPATAQSALASHRSFPDRIELPDGFMPEGIAISKHRGKPTAWFGSLANGDIYAANLRTGEGDVVIDGPGTPSVGLKIDKRGRLFVSGGPSGTARILSSRTGATLRDLTLATTPTFINDVVLTRHAAWFTDSMRAQLYRLPLGRHGSLPDQDDVRTLPLGGAWIQGGPGQFTANGIETTPDGRALLVMNSFAATVFRVNPRTGAATAVDLGGVPMTNGDGLLREGRTLYVVQNQLNQVSVIHLNRSGTRGTVKRVLTSADFDVPTTVARFGKSLYLPNARFGTTDPQPADYWATRIDKR